MECPRCGEHGTIACQGACESVKYCSTKCESTDHHAHHTLCSTFKEYQERLAAGMVRAIHFQVGEPEPKWIWLPAEVCNGRSEEKLKPYLGVAPKAVLKLDATITEFRTYVPLERAVHSIVVLYNSAHDSYGYRKNKDAVTTMDGGTRFPRPSTIIAYGIANPLGVDDSSSIHRDLEMIDVTSVSEVMIRHFHDLPASYAAEEQEGRFVSGVTIRCNGGAKEHDGQTILAARVPPQLFTSDFATMCQRWEIVSTTARLLGLPLLFLRVPMATLGGKITHSVRKTMKESSVAPWVPKPPKDLQYFTNNVAAVMHRHLHPSQVVYATPQSAGFGDVPEIWSGAVGDVLVVREDRKPLTPLVIEALYSFCEDVVGLRVQCIRSGEQFQGRKATKQALVNDLTPEKWADFYERFKAARGIEEDDSDVESDGEEMDTNDSDEPEEEDLISD